MTDEAEGDEAIAIPLGKLSVRQSAFVDAYLLNGGNGAQAAITAGFAESSAKQYSWVLLNTDKIQHALAQRGSNVLEAMTSKCLHVISDAIGDEDLPKMSRANLAAKMLDKSKTFAPSMKVDHQHNHEHNHQHTLLLDIQRKRAEREAKTIDITPVDVDNKQLLDSVSEPVPDPAPQTFPKLEPIHVRQPNLNTSKLRSARGE